MLPQLSWQQQRAVNSCVVGSSPTGSAKGFQQEFLYVKQKRAEVLVKYLLVNIRLDTLNLDFLLREYAKKGQFKGGCKYRPASEYLYKGSQLASHKLKIKLLREGIKLSQCEICGLSIWNNQPIPLELHYKDGDHYNNELENLQILCPNCHTQQENNSGAAIKKKSNKLAINEQSKEKKKEHFCPQCGKPFSGNGNVCIDCGHLNQRKTQWPDRETLKSEIRQNSFESLGRKYGVSGKSISKWCVAYQLPSRKTDIKACSDKGWAKV